MMGSYTETVQSTSYLYSFAYDQALGAHFMRIDADEDDRDFERRVYGVMYNRLLKRWNMPAAQANIFAGAGPAVATGSFDVTEPAGMAFLQADYETRRIYTMYRANLVHSDEFTHVKNVARVGVAPYLAEYDELNTWVILQAERLSEVDDRVTITPMLRFYKDIYLWEVGASLDGDPMFNFVVTY